MYIPGQTIYFLDEYRWTQGTVLSCGPKNVKIQYMFCGQSVDTTKPKEKCALPDEEIVVVWECWKGRNGRGGYRVERTMYPNERKPAKQLRKANLAESAYGVIDVNVTKGCL